ncbi:hypothetical protein [Microtetraspora sp. NBRC 16547]|uniref:hypothetical protein n=1 Tax=Microtetraspora sp. NBRC 16547 TaxID=3030993 RepID=UPI00249FFC17|nr:hypothetical protein [Microtetraspora sp. NBRC 16547]GLW98704.1 hypothetical protein Misp02_27910 [Microtetraspora sp. NBRC 16547]
MDDGGSIAGHRLTGRARSAEVGIWSEAISPEGTPSGVLRFDPGLVAAPAARERLVAAVTADRRLWQAGQGGLLPVTDLVTARGDIWLITGRGAMPVLADLLAQGGLPPGPGAVATILTETAQALLALHAAGLAHGALHPGTIVIAEDGSAVLAERGLLEALRGEHASPERDVAAWVTLARGLAASWADDRAAGGGAGTARLFDNAAAAASAHGLAAARDTLLTGHGLLPQGFTTRDGLLRTLHRWSVSSVPTSPAPPAAVPGTAPATGSATGSAMGSATGEAVTLLHLPDPAARTAPPPMTGPPTVPPTGPSMAGPPMTSESATDDVVMRFGPGVPTETTAAQIWRSGATTHLAAETNRNSGQRRRARRGAWAGSVLLAMLLAVVILWLRFQPAADVLVQKVDVRGPKKTVGCDGTASLVGTVTTNGGGGSIRYLWLRSDGVRMKEREQKVLSGDTSVELPLRWQVTGSGDFKGVATLRVLSPTSSGKPLQDKASFSYRC